MSAAVLTLVFFAITAVFANRSASLLGPSFANFLRLLLASLLLGLWAHEVGMGLGGTSFPWFFVSGLAGFGLGGFAMFQSLPRLGSSLSTLIVQCCTVWFAAGLEWLWLGTSLTALQLACAALTVLGVVLGLAPASWPKLETQVWRLGVFWALLSAFGQGLGAALSRKAFAVARASHAIPDAATSAYQRALGGLVVASLALVLVYFLSRRISEKIQPANLRKASPWLLANVLTGPVLGVTCYQWALSQAPAGVVQPVIAAAPLLTIPLACWIEKRVPRPLYYVGALLAVVGVCSLYLSVRK